MKKRQGKDPTIKESVEQATQGGGLKRPNMAQERSSIQAIANLVETANLPDFPEEPKLTALNEAYLLFIEQDWKKNPLLLSDNNLYAEYKASYKKAEKALYEHLRSNAGSEEGLDTLKTFCENAKNYTLKDAEIQPVLPIQQLTLPSSTKELANQNTQTTASTNTTNTTTTSTATTSTADATTPHHRLSTLQFIAWQLGSGAVLSHFLSISNGSIAGSTGTFMVASVVDAFKDRYVNEGRIDPEIARMRKEYPQVAPYKMTWNKHQPLNQLNDSFFKQKVLCTTVLTGSIIAVGLLFHPGASVVGAILAYEYMNRFSTQLEDKFTSELKSFREKEATREAIRNISTENPSKVGI